VCCIFCGIMTDGSTSVVRTVPVDEVDMLGYDDFFELTLLAFEGDPEARKEMTKLVALQHRTISEHVAEFLGTDMLDSGTIGNPLSSCNAGIEYLEEALFDIHFRSCDQVWSGLPWNEEHLVAHCNASYLFVLFWKSTGNSLMDDVGFVKLLGSHNRQWAEFCDRLCPRR